MDIESLSFHEITDVRDDQLLPWLDLYETSFPASERILVSAILQQLKEKMQGKAQRMHVLAANNLAGELVGLSMFNSEPERAAAFLWYMAVVKDRRGQGIGSRIYQEVLRRADIPPSGALIFEVEIPEGENTAEAERRIRFYHKQGAMLLTGIHYMQHVGWHQEPIPMHIMIHPLKPMQPQTAYDLTKSMVEDAIQATGELGLEPNWIRMKS